jgi:glycine/serine hydroxymethyltransferase
MKETEMKIAGQLIARIVREAAKTSLPEDKTLRAQAVKDYVASLEKNPVIAEVREAVHNLARKFPVPGNDTGTA